MLTEKLPIYQSAFELSKYVYTCVKRFEKTARIMVGERMVEVSLQMLDSILNANSDFSKERIEHLNKFKTQVERMKTLCRFCTEMKITNNKQSSQLAFLLSNVGKQLSGWRKSTIDKMNNRENTNVTEDVEKIEEKSYADFIASMNDLANVAETLIIKDN